MNRDTIPSYFLAGAAELIRHYQQDPVEISTMAKLSKEILFSNELSLTPLDFCNFLEISARTCNQRFFALELAKMQGIQILGPIWLLMRQAETVGEALTSLAKNFLLHTEAAAASIITEFDGISFCYDIIDDSLEYETQLIEHALTLVCMELKVLLGSHWRPKFTQFRYSAPYNLAPIKLIFGNNISFNQDRHAIHICHKDSIKPINKADGDYRKIIQQQLNARLEMKGYQIVMRTEVAIRTLISQQSCTINQIANTIGLSPRTLQRHLKQEAVSFKVLYEKVRLNIAKKYLLHSRMSITEIAERLHFSETAAFTRFFKRLTGMTPKNYSTTNAKP